jgi:hypothetical protein
MLSIRAGMGDTHAVFLGVYEMDFPEDSHAIGSKRI